jgi:hypothetical protein
MNAASPENPKELVFLVRTARRDVRDVLSVLLMPALTAFLILLALRLVTARITPFAARGQYLSLHPEQSSRDRGEDVGGKGLNQIGLHRASWRGRLRA